MTDCQTDALWLCGRVWGTLMIPYFMLATNSMIPCPVPSSTLNNTPSCNKPSKLILTPLWGSDLDPPDLDPPPSYLCPLPRYQAMPQ